MRRFVPVAVAMIALPTLALAQDSAPGPQKGDWEGTVSGSGSSNSDFDNHIFGIQGSAGKYLTNEVLVGVRQTFNYSDTEGGDDLFSGATRGFVDYVADFGRWRPFVGLSLGGIYGDGVNDSFAAGPEVGVKYYADNNTFIFLQTEYQFTFQDGDDATDSFDDGQFFHAVGVGMNF